MSAVLDIPPNAELFEDVEGHPKSGYILRVEFYKKPDGRYFVWPYIRQVRGCNDITQHFQVLEQFPSKEAAREAALAGARALIASGSDLDKMD